MQFPVQPVGSRGETPADDALRRSRTHQLLQGVLVPHVARGGVARLELSVPIGSTSGDAPQTAGAEGAMASHPMRPVVNPIRIWVLSRARAAPSRKSTHGAWTATYPRRSSRRWGGRQEQAVPTGWTGPCKLTLPALKERPSPARTWVVPQPRAGLCVHVPGSRRMTLRATGAPMAKARQLPRGVINPLSSYRVPISRM